MTTLDVQEEILSRRDMIEASLITCRWCDETDVIVSYTIGTEVPSSVRERMKRNMKSGEILYFCKSCKRYFTKPEIKVSCDFCNKILGRKRLYVNDGVYCSMDCLVNMIKSRVAKVVILVYHKDTYLEALDHSSHICPLCHQAVSLNYRVSTTGDSMHLSCMDSASELYLLVDTPLTNYTGD